MATVSVISAMTADTDSTLHRFFTRPTSPQRDDRTIADSLGSSAENISEEAAAASNVKPKRADSKRRKQDNDQMQGKQSTQRTLGEIINPGANNNTQGTGMQLNNSTPDLNDGRRKRRRTSKDESLDVGFGVGDSTERQGMFAPDPANDVTSSPRVIIRASSPMPERPHTPDEMVAPKTPPKKLLRLNASGRFSSPVLKKTQETETTEETLPKRRSTRQRQSTIINYKQCLLVRFKYGKDEARCAELGKRIDRILSGEETVPLRNEQVLPKKRTPRKPKAAKPTHPFFRSDGQRGQPSLPKPVSPRKASAVTPGKLRVQTLSDRPHDCKAGQPFVSELLRDKCVIRYPDAKEAPFPASGLVHIRGSEIGKPQERGVERMRTAMFGRRKLKQAMLPFPERNSIIQQVAAKLEPEADRRLRPDGFHEPNTSLEVPARLLIPGQEIAQRIIREVSAALVDTSDDELALSSQKRAHPALQKIYDKLPETLTAFDESKGEALQWTQKYAPSSSAGVLQPESETAVLRDWLKSLAVQSVGGAAPAPVKPGKAEHPKKKRKKKIEDMDGFLVESDEDVNEMSEVIGTDFEPSPGVRKTHHSIIQVATGEGKLHNVVLLSGPHGCGKTAAVYAVAKELNYRVFEMNASDRRSGRDVFEKIGDMTENHLVKHHGSEDVAAIPSTEELDEVDEAFQKDLQSGRQGKMSSFFKLQAKPKQPGLKNFEQKKLKVAQEVMPKPPKEQQQSLILLEEVDILFKEDKDFWTMVFKMIITSKRPFIMTCNDEDLVPVQAISLHAILRFSPPPLELASDYMLLVAAAEGHLLRREAVSSLYQNHNHDLRACIMELNYWCQMGIGDPRGGLTWIYQRYPPGSDLDEQGRKLRVVSDGTYQQGMGDLPSPDASEDALWWLWKERSIEPWTAIGWHSMPGLMCTSDVNERQPSLKQFSAFADAMSAAEAFSAMGLYGAAQIDPTQPDLPGKARASYIEGLQLLQTDERVEYSDLSQKLLIASTLSANRVWGFKNPTIVSKIQSLEPETLTRYTFACFDPITNPSEISVLDGPFSNLCLDIAPYIRSIVQHDQGLEEQRERLNLLMSDGRAAKRARTTRAARSAFGGGLRAKMRKERWFSNALDSVAVLETGGREWPRFVHDRAVASVSGEGTSRPASAGTGTGTGMDQASAGESVSEDEIRYEG